MPRARLTVTIPDSVWIGEISRRYPDTRFEILTAFPHGEGGVAMAEVSGPNVAAVVREMDQVEEVTSTEVLQHEDDTVLVQFETSNPVLLLPVRNAGTPLELPFSVVDGSVNWEVTAPGTGSRRWPTSCATSTSTSTWSRCARRSRQSSC